jgi:RND family efflux transporter MFP subunit
VKPDIHIFLRKSFLSTIFLLFSTSALAGQSSYEGVVGWGQQRTITAGVSGVVEKIGYSLGREFDQGETLIALDQRPFDTQVITQREVFSAASLAFQESEKAHGRNQELFDEGSMALVEMDQADLTLAKARANYEIANASLAGAKYRKALASVKAPFDGVAIELFATTGEYVNATSSAPRLMSIARREHFTIRVNVSAEKMPGVEIGSDANVAIAGLSIAGKITAIKYPQTEAPTSDYVIFVSFISANEQVVPGRIAMVSF